MSPPRVHPKSFRRFNALARVSPLKRARVPVALRSHAVNGVATRSRPSLKEDTGPFKLTRCRPHSFSNVRRTLIAGDGNTEHMEHTDACVDTPFFRWVFTDRHRSTAPAGP